MENINKKLPQSVKKTLKIIEDFIYSDFFMSEIKNMRFKYNIPEIGLSATEKDRIAFLHKPIIFLPDKICSKDSHENIKTSMEINRYVSLKILNDIYPRNMYLSFLVKYFLFFNELDKGLIENMINDFNNRGIIRVENLVYWKQENIDVFFNGIEENPVAILLNPETTKRDLLDFINKNFKNHIYPMLSLFKRDGLYSGVKTKNSNRSIRIKKIILENVSSSVSEISKKLVEQNIFLDKQNILKEKNKLKNKFKKLY